MSFKDYFSEGASDYARYRPNYPAELYQFISDQSFDHELAWDCACGNGQAALGLSAHFKTVIATDASSTQIANAFTAANVSYSIAPAEDSQIHSSTVDAVTVAQALHWFDLNRFYPEAKRVMKPGAVIAAWCYGQSSVDEEIDMVVKDMHLNLLSRYWAKEVQSLDQKYKTITFPFDEISSSDYQIRSQWNFNEYTGYLSTWSAIRQCIKEEGAEPVTAYFERMAGIWKEPERKQTVVTKLALRIGRK